MDVAELRMSISKIPDLSFAEAVEAMITLAQIALPILPFAVSYAAAGQDQDTNLATQIDGVSSRVFWCVI